MARLWLAVIAFMGATLAAGPVTAQALEQGATPDLRLPGAEAWLGWGNGYSSNAWSLLRLRASGGDAYALRLESESGTLRGGLKPLGATLELPPGYGVRETQVWVPLFTQRPVRLILSGPSGAVRATLQPLRDGERVSASFSQAGAYLGRVRAEASGEPTLALAALAGGARLTQTRDLEALGLGALGLGEVQRADLFNAPAVNLAQVAANLAPEVRPPARRSSALAWWSAAIFAVTLGVYSARRTHWRTTAWGGGAALALGGIGFAALQPVETEDSATRAVLVGAGGWGVRLEVTSRFNTLARTVDLPSGALVIAAKGVEHSVDATRVNATAWSPVSYWLPPRVARVPLQVDARGLENTADALLTDLYVVGRGNLEPLPRARRAFPALGKSPPWSGGTGETERLAALLPTGSAIARRGETVVIALPRQRGQP